MMPDILVAGIGNIFLGDDAFGVEVVRRLAGCDLPAGVRVVDFGISGFDLAYALLDDPDATILVDALPRGGEPGTLYLLEPDLDAAEMASGEPMETHNVHPLKVLGLVRALGGRPRQLYVLGCEPAAVASPDDDWQEGLSGPVAGALDGAIEMIESLVKELLAGRAIAGGTPG